MTPTPARQPGAHTAAVYAGMAAFLKRYAAGGLALADLDRALLRFAEDLVDAADADGADIDADQFDELLTHIQAVQAKQQQEPAPCMQ